MALNLISIFVPLPSKSHHRHRNPENHWYFKVIDTGEDDCGRLNFPLSAHFWNGQCGD